MFGNYNPRKLRLTDYLVAFLVADMLTAGFFTQNLILIAMSVAMWLLWEKYRREEAEEFDE